MKILGYIVLAMLGLFMISEWWEKALATRTGFAISPGGCYRLESYAPRWILPNMFHPLHSPDPEGYTLWILPRWEVDPTFYRLYDNRSGELMVTTGIYDYGGAIAQSDNIRWGHQNNASIGFSMMPIGLAKPDCLDG